MRLADRFGRHARESRLLAVLAGEAATPHVSSCALCQARLAELRTWVDATAGDAAAVADAVFTPERLAAQKQQVLARLEAAGRSARVIAFPFGAPAAAGHDTREVMHWVAAAAVAGILIGVASGRVIDWGNTTAPAKPGPVAAHAPAPAAPAASAKAVLEDLDEAALLEAAYDRISLDSLKTIDDMTPRAREVVLASMPGRR